MDGIWDLNDSNRYTTRQVHIDELKQIELDQGRRMNASEFWVCKVGLLEQTDEENFVFEEREGSSALKDLLISVTRTASNTPEPLAVFDIFGEEVCMNLAEQSELPHTWLAALEANRGKVLKITAGVLLEKERTAYPGAVCKVILHDRITFRDRF